MAQQPSDTSNGALKAPLSFILMQNDQCIFLQINLDKKEFNEAQTEAELIVIPET